MTTLIQCPQCEAQWVSDGIEQCPQCGTVVDVAVYEDARPNDADRWERWKDATFWDVVSPSEDTEK